MAAVSIFPDENLGWGVWPSVLAVVLQPGDQLKEGPAPRLKIVCCSAFEYVTRLALQRTVADRRALLEPPYDLVIKTPHVDSRHSFLCVVKSIAHSVIRRIGLMEAAESAWIAVD